MKKALLPSSQNKFFMGLSCSETKNLKQRNKMKTHTKLLEYSALILGAATTSTALASSDYGPAIWNPPSCTKWYTSGYGHKFCVVHDMEGYYSGSVSYLNNCNVSASVYYDSR